MKRYKIIRTSPTEGIVVRLNNLMQEEIALPITDYQSCKKYLNEHQYESTVYRITRTGIRKNAARHLVCSILCDTLDDALNMFSSMIVVDGQYYELLTGDFKPVADRKDAKIQIKIKKETNQHGTSIQ